MRNWQQNQQRLLTQSEEVFFMFSLAQIAITAGIMVVVSLLLLFGARPFFKIRSPAEIILIALAAGFSVLAFRASANTTVLNADPIPAISPNDILCPVMTYVFLGVYGAFCQEMVRQGKPDGAFK
jgi:hypothetical protein